MMVYAFALRSIKFHLVKQKKDGTAFIESQTNTFLEVESHLFHFKECFSESAKGWNLSVHFLKVGRPRAYPLISVQIQSALRPESLGEQSCQKSRMP
jgi:hypothetical protein